MKKHQYCIFQCLFLACFCISQVLFHMLAEYVSAHYNGYLVTQFHFVVALLFGVLFWVGCKRNSNEVPLWQKALVLVLWLAVSACSFPLSLLRLNLLHISPVLMGASWLITGWHLTEFISQIIQRKKAAQK